MKKNGDNLSMNKKKVLLFLLSIIAMLLSNFYIIKYLKLENNKEMKLSYVLKSNDRDSYQIFYGQTDNWEEGNFQFVEYKKINKDQKIEYYIPKEDQKIRLDFGDKNTQKKIEIKDLRLEYDKRIKKIDILNSGVLTYKNDISSIERNDNKYIIQIQGNDAFIVLSSEKLKLQEFISERHSERVETKVLKIVLCLLIDFVLLLIVKKLQNIFSLLVELKNNRKLIFNLAKNDFKTKYAGSYLGIIWAFVNPIITIVVYWFVFEYGLRAGSPIKGVPYVLWLMSGLIPWFFYSDGINSATNSMYEYSYLVKKVVFKISILPIVKIISTLFIQLVFIAFLFVVAFIYKMYPTVYMLQLFYYLFCLFFIILATSYVTSSIILFFKDLGQLINIFLQIGIWATPIMWSYNIVPERYQWIVKLNPMVYIIEGYRDSIINHIWFWEKQIQTIYFWFISLGLFLLGVLIFKKLKPHFADVL